MKDFFLKTTDATVFMAAMRTAGLIAQNEEGADFLVTAGQTFVLDVIGILPGVNGFHANLRLLDDADESAFAALIAFAIPAPKTPSRFWA